LKISILIFDAESVHFILSLYFSIGETKQNGKNGKFLETKRDETERKKIRSDSDRSRNETKRKPTGNKTKHTILL
jgi:hypothetical protein